MVTVDQDQDRRSLDPADGRATTVGQSVVSLLSQPDRLTLVRHAGKSAAQVGELAALNNLRWVRCRFCDVSMVIPPGMDEPPTCPDGHPGPFIEHRSVESERIIAQLADAIRRWLADLPIENTVDQRLERTHGYSKAEADPLVAVLADQVRTQLEDWPTAWLAELHHGKQHEDAVFLGPSRVARVIDDLLHNHLEAEARPERPL